MMTENTLIRAVQSRTATRSGRWDDLARRLVLDKLSQFKTGQIRVIENGVTHLFGADDKTLQATVRVHDPRFYRAMALGGSLGAAEAYIDGMWTTDNLTAVCRLAVRNLLLLCLLSIVFVFLWAPIFRRARVCNISVFLQNP